MSERRRSADKRTQPSRGGGHERGSPRPPEPRAEATPNETGGPLVEGLAAGAHDAALARLAAGRTLRDPASPVRDEPELAAWQARYARPGAHDGSPAPGDAEVLALGRALQARVAAQHVGVPRSDRGPALCRRTRVDAPLRAVESARATHATPVVDLAVAAGVGRELWDERVEHWVKLPPGVPPGRYLALRIAGESMAPLMHTGDTVLVAVGAALRRGAIVVARHPDDGYVCKRVRRIGRKTVELDSLAEGGPTRVLPRDERLIVGRVVFVWGQEPAD